MQNPRVSPCRFDYYCSRNNHRIQSTSEPPVNVIVENHGNCKQFKGWWAGGLESPLESSIFTRIADRLGSRKLPTTWNKVDARFLAIGTIQNFTNFRPGISTRFDSRELSCADRPSRLGFSRSRRSSNRCIITVFRGANFTRENKGLRLPGPIKGWIKEDVPLSAWFPWLPSSFLYAPLCPFLITRPVFTSNGANRKVTGSGRREIVL